jgi:YVTN family beta-propeller protein
MRLLRSGRLTRRLATATTLTMLTVATLSAGPLSGTASAQDARRELVLVGNNDAGTVSFIDAVTFVRLFDVDIIPDLQQRLAEMTPVERVEYELVRAQMGGDKYVDDVAVSPDGRTLYVSRSNLADAAAFDIRTRRLLWRTRLDGLRADHLALSRDGTRLVISAVTAKKVHALDTATGRIVGSFPTGDYPHQLEYSPDGRRIYNASIGNVVLPDWLDALKGQRVFTVVDAQTLKVTKTFDLGGRGIRPFFITPDEKYVYAQLSFLHGFVEYSLEQGRITRTVDLPILGDGRTMPTADYPNDSAHHGLALSKDGTKICDAGTVSDYVAILSRPALTVDRILHTGDQPYWATTSVDGRYCFVSNSLSDTVSVISYATATEVARIPVGAYPQRLHATTVPGEVLAG